MPLKDFRRVAARALLRAETDAPDQGMRAGAHWVVLVVAVAASAIMAVRLGQDVSWDFQNYHYYSGYAFLNKPLDYDFAPGQEQSFHNPLLHVPTWLMISRLPARAAAALLGALQGLNLYLVFLISWRLFRRWNRTPRFLISLGNAAAGFYGTIQIAELGTTFGDTLVSIPILAGLLIVLIWLQSREEGRRRACLLLFPAGLLAGVAFGLKATVIVYVAGLLVCMTILMIRRRMRAKCLAVFCIGLAAGFVAAYGYWGVHLHREYRNPVYPYLNQIFRSPFYSLENTRDARFLPRTWQEGLFYPFYFAHRNVLASEVNFRDARMAIAHVSLLLLALTSIFQLARFRRRNQSTRDPGDSTLLFLAGFLAISYVAWQHLFSIYRYAAVLELLIPVFLALLFSVWCRKRTVALAISLAVNVAIVNSVIPMDFGRQPFRDGLWKVLIPPIRDLDRSVVVMAGTQATSYIVPSFPATTRFVRVSSNFMRPGYSAGLDRKILQVLASYDPARILAYVSSADEMSLADSAIRFYGLRLDAASCRQLRSSSGRAGWLCGTLKLDRAASSGVSNNAAARFDRLRESLDARR